MIDLFEDEWGQGRAGRINDSNGVTNGFIDTAYIEAITPIGLFQLGTNGLNRFGYGTWSDSGLKGNGTHNAGVTYGIKVDKFVATLSYIKYLDFAQNVFDNAAGYPAGFLTAWPGRAGLDSIGGSGSRLYNGDTDTYIMTAHYIGDKFKVGGIFQWILDPQALAASYLVRGIADIGAFEGSFAGESNWLGMYGVQPAWPIPTGAYGVKGFGRAGMYGANLFIAGLYFDAKFMNDKLDVKGEYDRIFGSAERNAWGDAYNAWLAAHAGAPYGVRAGWRLPEKIGVDGTTAYLDVSYDFDVAKVGLAFLYGGGEEHWRPYTQTHFNFNTTGNDDFHFGNVIVPGDSNMLGNSYAPLGLGNNPENVTAVKLYWSVDPMENLDIHGAFIWAKYSVPVGRYARGATGALVNNWNAFYGHPINYINPTGTSYIPAGLSTDLGWEVDLGATYTIMEGLTLNSEFGVLFTGDAFDYRNTATMEREDWGPIYRWVNTLTYEF